MHSAVCSMANLEKHFHETELRQCLIFDIITYVVDISQVDEQSSLALILKTAI